MVAYLAAAMLSIRVNTCTVDVMSVLFDVSRIARIVLHDAAT
jgi:hypothetical protein